MATHTHKTTSMPYRLPTPEIRFTSDSTSLGFLLDTLNSPPEIYPWATRMLGRFPLPSWQRGLCWTIEQKKKFIESVFSGFDLGSVMINSYKYADGNVTVPLSDILIDGQQRLDALLSFCNNDFDYCGFFWEDLNRREKRRFLERQIGVHKTDCFDEILLKKTYNLLNFSGVAHKEGEIA